MWVALWSAWILLGVGAEAVALIRERKDDTLTEYSRAIIVRTAFGSATVGAFLCWLAWHWLFVSSGLGWEDVAAILVGSIVGLAGHQYRDHTAP